MTFNCTLYGLLHAQLVELHDPSTLARRFAPDRLSRMLDRAALVQVNLVIVEVVMFVQISAVFLPLFNALKEDPKEAY